MIEPNEYGCPICAFSAPSPQQVRDHIRGTKHEMPPVTTAPTTAEFARLLDEIVEEDAQLASLS